MTSAIEWTQETWNPIVGCSRVSEGCRNCYAERVASRFGGGYSGGVVLWSHYQGLTKKVNGHPQWTGEVRLVEEALEKPLRWKKPRRIFVNSMSDLFHEAVMDEWIDRIFSVMGKAKQHTFQVLTKRPERMLAYLGARVWRPIKPIRVFVGSMYERQPDDLSFLPNVWLGVSVEDQATADERIPLLLRTPAAVRWVSYEPALGPVDFRRWLAAKMIGGPGEPTLYGLDWIVVGGESGPGARPFDLAWARQTIAQGRAAGVPVFVKQLGAKPEHQGGPLLHPDGPTRIQHLLRDRKGGDMAEWPEDLRVREYPRK